MARRSTALRRAAHRRGHFAEWIAILFLMAKGYRILARRYLVKGGEIDIVALRGDVVAFVEVKARRDFDAGLLSITHDKQQRFARAVDHWLSRHAWAASYTQRCDAVIIVPRRWPRHVEDAFG